MKADVYSEQQAITPVCDFTRHAARPGVDRSSRGQDIDVSATSLLNHHVCISSRIMFNSSQDTVSSCGPGAGEGNGAIGHPIYPQGLSGICTKHQPFAVVRFGAPRRASVSNRTCFPLLSFVYFRHVRRIRLLPAHGFLRRCAVLCASGASTLRQGPHTQGRTVSFLTTPGGGA